MFEATTMISRKTAKTYVAETAEDDEGGADEQEADADQDAEQDFDNDEIDSHGEAEDNEDDEDISSALVAAAECSAVTARRLQGVTLVRRFSGAPKSIQEGMQNTHCAVCGEKGHWQGDPECQYSKEGKGGSNSDKKPHAKGKSSGGSKGAGKDQKAKKVLSVIHHDGQPRTIELSDPLHPDPPQ